MRTASRVAPKKGKQRSTSLHPSSNKTFEYLYNTNKFFALYYYEFIYTLPFGKLDGLRTTPFSEG
jgi:hypothetical protein